MFPRAGRKRSPGEKEVVRFPDSENETSLKLESPERKRKGGKRQLAGAGSEGLLGP